MQTVCALLQTVVGMVYISNSPIVWLFNFWNEVVTQSVAHVESPEKKSSSSFILKKKKVYRKGNDWLLSFEQILLYDLISVMPEI